VDQIDTGMIVINHPIRTQTDLPLGGTKCSSYGWGTLWIESWRVCK